ncbi:MAG: PEP-CTERM sorting domain-containing protein [Bryobacteraceae bacterium]
MRRIIVLVALLSVGVLCSKSYGARFAFTLDAQSNVFGAGLSNPLPIPAGVFNPSAPNSGQGLAPTAIPIDPAMPGTPPPFVVLSFSSMTGGVWFDNNPPANTSQWGGPDGIPRTDLNTDLSSINNISGFYRTGRIMFVVGVFLGPTAPTGAAPPSLNFDTAENTVAFRPLIGQTFYVGDGRTAGGVTQQFWVPQGATRLYLGFGDGMLFQGTPSYFADNQGSFSVSGSFDATSSAIPEPASLGLGLLGAVFIAARVRRSRRA